MLDSQVCCVNFLFPFKDDPESLLVLLRSVYPEAEEVLRLDDEESYLGFEWIGGDHLGEWPKNGTPTRAPE